MSALPAITQAAVEVPKTDLALRRLYLSWFPQTHRVGPKMLASADSKKGTAATAPNGSNKVGLRFAWKRRGALHRSFCWQEDGSPRVLTCSPPLSE